jgi:hypothetical protein
MQMRTGSRAGLRSVFVMMMGLAMVGGSAPAASALDLALKPIVSPLVDGVDTATRNALTMLTGATEEVSY